MAYSTAIGKILRRLSKKTRMKGLGEIGKEIEKGLKGGKKGGKTPKSRGKVSKLSKITRDPRFLIGIGLLPEITFGAGYLLKERRKSQEMKWRKQREERKSKELFQKESELEQRRQREHRKISEIEIRRMALLKSKYPEVFERLSKAGLTETIKRKRAGRPLKRGRKQEWFTVKRGGKVYRIRRGSRSKKGRTNVS